VFLSVQYTTQKSCMKLLSPVLFHVLSSNRPPGYAMACLAALGC